MLSTMLSAVRNLVDSQNGATAIEYTMLIALIAIAMMTAMDPLGDRIQSVFMTAGNAMD